MLVDLSKGMAVPFDVFLAGPDLFLSALSEKEYVVVRTPEAALS